MFSVNSYRNVDERIYQTKKSLKCEEELKENTNIEFIKENSNNGKEYFKKNSQRIIFAAEEIESNNAKAIRKLSGNSLSDDNNLKNCLICLQNEANCILMECGHAGFNFEKFF